MSDLIAAFCAYHHHYNNISEGRRVQQAQVLRKLEASLDGREIASLTSQDLEAYLATCDVKPATVLKYLKMIRPFVRWMWKNGHITGDAMLHLNDVKAPRGAGHGKPRPYTRTEVARFWRDFDRKFPWTRETDPLDNTPKRAEYWVQRWQNNPDSFEWWRVQPYARRLQAEAIVTLALYGGLRRVEIFNLELDDVHYENAYVRVMGAAKNHEAESIERAVPMLAPMRVAMANWIEFRAQVLNPQHDRPWLNLAFGETAGPLSFDSFGRMLSGVGDGYELHRMRHTFATERLRSSMPVETLRMVMGHTDIAMTLRYAQIGTEDILRVAEKTNNEFVAALARGEGDESDG